MLAYQNLGQDFRQNGRLYEEDVLEHHAFLMLELSKELVGYIILCHRWLIVNPS